MIDIENKETEKAILVGVSKGLNTRRVTEEHLEELELLADTAGAETVIKFFQDRDSYDPAYFIGKGKAEEILEYAKENNINLVIFDDDLNPTQLRNLEKLFERKILDRSALILDIFASHAKTKEAKTQVELAQLQYMLPRLTRAWTHLSKQLGGIGTKGPGETQIETDRRIIRTRISKLKDTLKKIEAQHVTKSAGRQDLINVSLVGYTNAGKSTLLNQLTGADVLAEDKLFATLDSTTRSFDLDKNKKVLLSDTVGFIRKLPPHLVASFKTTLNVVREADLILHIIDVSNEFYEEHIEVVDETLKSLGCETKPQIKVFNKIDLLEDKQKLEFISQHYKDCVFISSMRGFGINSLIEKISDFYEMNYIVHTIHLKQTQGKLISAIYELADILESIYEEDSIVIKYRTSKEMHNKILSMLQN